MRNLITNKILSFLLATVAVFSIFETTVRTAEASSAVARHGALSVVGTDIVDQFGEKFQLRGISTHGINWDVGEPFVNQAAFQTLRDDWGANAVRLSLYTAEYNGYCTDGDQTELKNILFRGVEAATNLGMYVIIDWHMLTDNNPLTHLNQAKSFFSEVSLKYKDYKNVIYEICNEPSDCPWEDIKSYANAIIPIIRANDPDAIIVVGTPSWSQLGSDEDTYEVADSPLTGYTNIMYVLHFYAAEEYHTLYLRTKLVNTINRGIPVFVSEFGLSEADGEGSIDTTSADTWLTLLDQYNLSYFCWSLSNKDESCALLKSSTTKTSGWSDSELSSVGLWIKAQYNARSGQDPPLSPDSYSPKSVSCAADACSGIITVEMNAGDSAWTAVSNHSWITVTAGSSGTESGTVSYTVAANTDLSRTGTITIGGQTFTITQSGATPACTYTLSPCAVSFVSSNSMGSVTVTSSESTCSWTAASSESWVDITAGSSGTGTGNVAYSVAANTAESGRTGILTIAGQMFTVIQSGTNPSMDTVQKAYIGYYQRPADPAGLIWWADYLASHGGSLSAIIEAFANSAESQALYGAIDSNKIAGVIDAIYLALFNREADTAGRDWYVAGFNAGSFTAATIMLNVLYGAQNDDLVTLNNKLITANLFTKTIDPELISSNFQATYTGDTDAVAARSFLRSVTSSSSTIPTQSQTTEYIRSYIADAGDPILNQ